jgi:hypothetical protein
VITTFTRDQNKSTGTVSATTTIAALLTFMLGAYALLGDVRIAAAAAVATTGILVVREELHGWVAKLSLAELESGLILLSYSRPPRAPMWVASPSGSTGVRSRRDHFFVEHAHDPLKCRPNEYRADSHLARRCRYWIEQLTPQESGQARHRQPGVPGCTSTDASSRRQAA